MSMEKSVSELLRRTPRVREIVKLGYQFCNVNLSRLRNDGNMTNTKSICINNDRDLQYMFGYYDKSPWDQDGNRMLTLQIPFSNRQPTGERAVVCVHDITTGDIHRVCETETWNLQQGCMLQWLGPDYSDLIIFNSLQDCKYVSLIYDLRTHQKTLLSRPVYSVSRDGTKALSLNFSRLHRLRPGYGYSILPDPTEGIPHPTDDGIWVLDINNNKSKLIISLDDIVNYDWNSTMDGVEHKFNHLEINPSAKRFMFLHRWRKKNIGYSRLFTADLDGRNLYCIADDQMVSHSCWKNDYEIVSWARKEGEGDRFFCFKDQTSDFEVVAKDVLDKDGHPSFSPDGRFLLSDTYPDKYRMRSLIIWDIVAGQKYDVGRFYTPFKYNGDLRCDLHPRWSRDGKYICFDSVHEGNRQQYIIESPIE